MLTGTINQVWCFIYIRQTSPVRPAATHLKDECKKCELFWIQLWNQCQVWIKITMCCSQKTNFSMTIFKNYLTLCEHKCEWVCNGCWHWQDFYRSPTVQTVATCVNKCEKMWTGVKQSAMLHLHQTTISVTNGSCVNTSVNTTCKCEQVWTQWVWNKCNAGRSNNLQLVAFSTHRL